MYFCIALVTVLTLTGDGIDINSRCTFSSGRESQPAINGFGAIHVSSLATGQTCVSLKSRLLQAGYVCPVEVALSVEVPPMEIVFPGALFFPEADQMVVFGKQHLVTLVTFGRFEGWRQSNICPRQNWCLR